MRDLFIFIYLYLHGGTLLYFPPCQPCFWIQGNNAGVGMKYCIMEIPVNLCDVCSRHERPKIPGYHGERLNHCQVRKSTGKRLFSFCCFVSPFCTRDTRLTDTGDWVMGILSSKTQTLPLCDQAG